MDHLDPTTYSFDDFLAESGQDWLEDDPLLRRWLGRSALAARDRKLVAMFGCLVATRLRRVADVVERPENAPFLALKGPYNQPREEVVLPPETVDALAEVHGSGLWRNELDERARYAAVYMLNQNGEHGIACSVACTDGLARVLRRDEHQRSRELVDRLQTADRTSWFHGAQFVTEIQGGSDAATNAVRAEAIGDGLYSLSGQKWFCSNCTADFWLITARLPDGPRDHRGIGLFCVPRVLAEAPNGHHFERLKEKLGTRALATAELTLDGAKGWPVCPLDAGLKTMVAIVLTTSRVHNIVAAAAFARRAVREARAYASFRRAFGIPLDEQPLLAASLARLEIAADRAAAGAFATVDTWIESLATDDADTRLWARVLVSIGKAVACRRCPSLVYEAMMMFGGNGIEERFCALPRLWRDAAILETWEGPYTLLLMQALEDLVKYRVQGREEGFLALGMGTEAAADEAPNLAAILACPDLPANVVAWEALATRLYLRFEQRSLEALMGS